MGRSEPADTLLDRARVVLRRLAEAPHVVEAMHAAEAEIDRMWRRTPWTIGLGGEIMPRTALVNAVCGEPLIDPDERPPGTGALRLMRGDAWGGTRFRAVALDERVTEGELPPAAPDGEGPRGATLENDLGVARTELKQQQALVVAAEAQVPALVRATAVRWLQRPLRWLMRWFRRAAIVAWHGAQVGRAKAQQRLAELESSRTRAAVARRAARDAQLRPLRELCARRDLREIAITVDGPPLPEGVELVELAGTSRAEAEIDAVMLAAPDGLYAPARDERASLRLGDQETLLPQLATLAARARTLQLALRVRDRVRAGLATIEEVIASAELNFRARVEKFEMLRIPDREAFVRDALARVQPQVFTSVHAILEHASVHLGTELAELATTAIESIAAATNGDELKAAAAKIDDTWDATTRRIADEVRVLVAGGAGGTAHDLVLELLRLLVAHGLPEAELRARRARPELAPLDVLPSIMRPKETSVGTRGWLGGLFQSFEARRTKARERAHEAIEHLKQVASAELLDLEPRLHETIRDAVQAELAAALTRQQTWLDDAIGAEQAAIARERMTLQDATRVREAVMEDLADLELDIAEVERAEPALAAAAAATLSASAVLRL